MNTQKFAVMNLDARYYVECIGPNRWQAVFNGAWVGDGSCKELAAHACRIHAASSRDN